MDINTEQIKKQQRLEYMRIAMRKYYEEHKDEILERKKQARINKNNNVIRPRGRPRKEYIIETSA